MALSEVLSCTMRWRVETTEPPPKLLQKHPQVKKILSAPAVVAGAGSRLFTSAPGMVARARVRTCQGPAAVAPPELYPGTAQMHVPECEYTWSLGISRGEPVKYILSIIIRPQFK